MPLIISFWAENMELVVLYAFKTHENPLSYWLNASDGEKLIITYNILQHIALEHDFFCPNFSVNVQPLKWNMIENQSASW